MDYPKGIHVNELSNIVKIDAKKLARVLRLLATRGCYNEGRAVLNAGKRIPHSSRLLVETDTFANNRLSLTLHNENPVHHMISLRTEVTGKGASVLYETLKDSRTAYSEEPEHAAFMYANNKEGITGTFFDCMRQDVRKFSIHVS